MCRRNGLGGPGTNRAARPPAGQNPRPPRGPAGPAEAGLAEAGGARRAGAGLRTGRAAKGVNLTRPENGVRGRPERRKLRGGCTTTAMSWERRGNGWYYYRRRKVGGKVVSEYIGAASGLIAPARALIDADRRALRAAIRENRRRALEAERASSAEAEASDRAWYDRIEATTRGALEAAGCHQHARGKWMKTRMIISN